MKKLFILFFFTCLSVFAFGQRTVSGIVSDDTGESLIGANVVAKGTTVGTITDIDGSFSFELPAGIDVLEVSYTGYITQEVDVSTATVVNVILTEGSFLDEVVVTGYRTAAKIKSTSAQSLVNSSTIQDRPNLSVAQTLQGQVAGLNITTNSGQPGGDSNINLRGISSINGNTEPLFVIDGMPVNEDNFRSLNQNDIESVAVLKDASATAIYGNRGANGVIEIRTKTGKFNSKLKVNYDGFYAIESIQNNEYNLMDGPELLRLEQMLGRGRGSRVTDEEINSAATTDWLNYFLRDANGFNHNLTLTGGGENTNFFTSLGYVDREGLLVQSGLKRYSLRNNLNVKSRDNKLNLGLNLTLNYSNSGVPISIGSGAVNRNYVLGGLQSLPYITPEDYVDGRSLLSPLTLANTPLFLMDRLNTFTRAEREIRGIGSLSLSYKLTDYLTIGTTIGGDLMTETETRAEGPESFNALLFAQTGNETPGFQEHDYKRIFSYNWFNKLIFDKTFDDHGITVGLYTEYFRAHFDEFELFQEGLDPRTFSPGDGSAFVSDNADNDFFVPAVDAELLNAGLFSYFGTLDYDYKGRYGLSASIRRDASYRFSESNRWGTFWSVGGRWNIDQEPFFDIDAVDLFKLRASYGIVGNQRIVDVDENGTNHNDSQAFFYGPDLTSNFFQTGSGYGGRNSLFLNQIGNNTLRWEEVKDFNVGLDAEFFGNRLRGAFDYYIRETHDLFQDRPVSLINGISELRANVGSMRNSGIDVSLAYDIHRGVKSYFTLSFVGNYNKNEILEIPTPDNEVISGFLIDREGGAINEYYLYRYAGVNPANGNLLFYDAEGGLTENPSPDTDRMATGKNIYPDFQGGFGISTGFHGFYLDAQFNYTIGVYRYDFDLAGFQDPGNVGQFVVSKDLNRAWTTPGQITDIPSLTANNISLDSNSDRYLFKSDYLRLRFVRFGYNLEDKLLKKIGAQKLGLWVGAENLQTWTSWRGLDAESGFSANQNDFPSSRAITFGLSLSF